MSHASHCMSKRSWIVPNFSYNTQLYIRQTIFFSHMEEGCHCKGSAYYDCLVRGKIKENEWKVGCTLHFLERNRVPHRFVCKDCCFLFQPIILASCHLRNTTVTSCHKVNTFGLKPLMEGVGLGWMVKKAKRWTTSSRLSDSWRTLAHHIMSVIKAWNEGEFICVMHTSSILGSNSGN